MNRELKYALGKTIPILFSYLFLSMAFGIMMNQAGFAFYWAYLVSLTVYTGAFQFVIVSFLSAGALLGQLIPFDFEGVDFCMTALFVTILIDQWRKSENHAPAVIGGVSAVLFLLLFGSSRFMLPFLLLNKRELPKRIEYLGNVFPMAIMATLVVYCLKSVPESALQGNLILLAGVLVTAVIHIWKKSSILSITVGTVVYMVLVHFV